MKKSILLLLLLFIAPVFAFSQIQENPKPKLIVGIVVDQMRYDYITRYWNKFGENGFKKLVKEGFNCSNTHYNYVPTYTGPGHTSIYTGTTPASHGIISNSWYSRSAGREIYVTEDAEVNSVGTDNTSGKMSPVQLLSTTISDEIRVASNFRSKVVGIALKDRSAILPAGRSANAAYWFDALSGNWISSSWYMKTLPDWVVQFNDKKLPAGYMQQPWNTLLPIDQYSESTADDVPYEEPFPGETKPVFPHNFPVISAGKYDLLKSSPYGCNLTREFAVAAMKAEQLGKDEFTDVLAVSFSSPDYVGHQFGTHAIETEDIYLRLDLDIATLISETEKYCGAGNVLFFLTADHAAIPNIRFLSDHKILAGQFNIAQLTDSLNKFLNSTYGTQKWVLAVDNDQVYLNHDLIAQQKINANEVISSVKGFIKKFKGVAEVLTADDLSKGEFTFGIKSFVQKGFYGPRSGDLAFILEPGYIEYKSTGTTHGAAYTYDTHVPLIFRGAGIKKGDYYGHVDITDIAPTISQMLGIQPPNAATGKVIEALFK